jgi:hypothetical protein
MRGVFNSLTCILNCTSSIRVQSGAGHNLRWDSDKIMRRAAINDKRIYHFSMVNGHLSLGRCKPLACFVPWKDTPAALNHYSFNLVPPNDNC